MALKIFGLSIGRGNERPQQLTFLQKEAKLERAMGREEIATLYEQLSELGYKDGWAVYEGFKKGEISNEIRHEIYRLSKEYGKNSINYFIEFGAQLELLKVMGESPCISTEDWQIIHQLARKNRAA